MIDSQPATTWYLLWCLECDHASGMDLDMPFESAEARGRWAAEHTRATGHARWHIVDRPRRRLE